MALSGTQKTELMRQYLHLSLYPDAMPALESLHGRKLAILSNGSPDMLEPLVANTGLLIAGIPFPQFEPYQKLLWAIGGAIVVGTLFYWISQTWQNTGTSSKSGRTPKKGSMKGGSCCQGGHKL